MDTHQRVAIVGGGIFGHATAHELGRAGYSHVEVFDRGELGAGSTALAAGVLSLQTWNDLDAQLILETRRRVEDLVAWGRGEGHPAAAHAWRPRGGITVAGPARKATLEEIHARLLRTGESAQLLSGPEARRRFPAFLFEDQEWVLASPTDGTLESSDLLDLLRRRCLGFGVRFRPFAPVSEIRVQRGRVEGLRMGAGTAERFDKVVVAAGAWTRALLAAAHVPLPAIPYRTQLATLELEGSDSLPVLHDTVHHFYARPESATRMLAGDGTQLREFDAEAFDRAADASFIESIAQGVVRRFRDGHRARYRTGWAGLCVGTPDRRPLAGAVSAVQGLYVLTGDNGFGLMRGMALGRVVAAVVQGRPDGSSKTLAPDRFGDPPPSTFRLSEGFSLPD